jgi:hypothetical protein
MLTKYEAIKPRSCYCFEKLIYLNSGIAFVD